MKNAINWFEIPVVELPRAISFYEQVFAAPLKQEVFFGTPHAIFKAEGVAGALVKDARRKPQTGGPLPYLHVDGSFDAALERVTKAGGKLLLPRTEIGPQGSIAVMLDTEGNEVGLHQPRAQ